jgi:pterin-4a-carbinolamine dehydratase
VDEPVFEPSDVEQGGNRTREVMCMSLADRSCVPWKTGTPALGEQDITPLLAELSGWTVRVEETRKLWKRYGLPDFVAALELANRIGFEAERQDHHPDLLVAWGRLESTIWTHAASGLTENDFVLAAKCDRIYEALVSARGDKGQLMRRHVFSGSPYEPRIGFSRAVRIGSRILVSGTAPIWPDGSCDPDPEVQARRCLDIIIAALGEAGAGPEHVVRTRMFITHGQHADAVGRAHGSVFANVRPAATMVVVAGLLDPRWKVEIEAEALVE